MAPVLPYRHDARESWHGACLKMLDISELIYQSGALGTFESREIANGPFPILHASRSAPAGSAIARFTRKSYEHTDTKLRDHRIRAIHDVRRHPMGPVAARPDLHDGDRQPAICLTLFTKPLSAKLGIALPELQVTFSILIVLQTLFSPFQGALIDRYGPRLLISIGTVLSGLSWVLASQVHSTSMLYLTYGGLGGLGTGIVYVGVVGLMVRWFPNHRGMAAGAVAAGYGMGAIVTTFPIASSLEQRGLESTLWLFGAIFAVVGLLAAQGLRTPPALSAAAQAQASNDWRPTQMLKTPVFWLMFLMMTMMCSSGLMVTSQLATFARDFGVGSMTVFGLAAIPLALTIDRFTNGLTRPFFGLISDRFGREQTMCFCLRA